jgi:hypothetical protein
MARIKAIGDIADKYARVAPQRADDYTKGVQDPSVDWQRATAGSSDAYEAGVTDAIGRKAFAKGVDAAGNEKWKRRTADVGAARWPAGVRAAKDDYATAFQPFRDVIERTALPPRAPRGDPRNQERAAVMARALTDARRARK